MKKLIPFFIIYSLVFILAIIVIVLTDKGECLLFLNANQTPLLNIIFILLSIAVEVPIFILLAFILLWKNYRASIQIGAVGILTLIITISLKAYFAHPRPLIHFEHEKILDLIKLIPYSEPILGFTSFPSGHTTAAFGMMLSLAIIFKRTWVSILTVLLAIGTAISRIYLVNHFIEDVVAGSLLGICIALFVYKLLNYFKVPSMKSIISLKKVK